MRSDKELSRYYFKGQRGVGGLGLCSAGQREQTCLGQCSSAVSYLPITVQEEVVEQLQKLTTAFAETARQSAELLKCFVLHPDITGKEPGGLKRPKHLHTHAVPRSWSTAGC